MSEMVFGEPKPSLFNKYWATTAEGELIHTRIARIISPLWDELMAEGHNAIEIEALMTQVVSHNGLHARLKHGMDMWKAEREAKRAEAPGE